MAKQKPAARSGRFIIDMEMLPSNDLIFCDMFENASLFTQIIQAVIGKNENVELIEPPLSQVAYKNPQLSPEKKIRLGTIRVDVQAEGKYKLYSLDMQNKYNEKIVLNRAIFYSFRIYTTQPIKDMRYDRLKPACVTFIMSETQWGSDQAYDTHRFTVIDETSGIKYFNILDSYIVFVPDVIKNRQKLNDDLYIFSRFLAIHNQADANKFEKIFGKNKLGKELIKLYKNSLAKKNRLLGVVNYSYYFTEKEYERVKMADDEKHAKEVLKLTEQLKLAKEAEKQALEAKKQAKKQTLEGAVSLFNSGIDIKVISDSLRIPVSDIEEFIRAQKILAGQ